MPVDPISLVLALLGLVALALLGLVAWTLTQGERLLGGDTEPHEVALIRRADGGALHADRWLVRGEGIERRGVVVTCHGIGANRIHMDFDPEHSLAQALNRAGYEVWNIDLRGVGKSRALSPGDRAWSVDDHVDIDVPAVLEEVTRATGAPRVHWVGHSMGGLVAYGWLATHPAEDRLASLVTLGSPVCGAPGPLERLTGRLASWIAGWLPAIPSTLPSRAGAMLVLPVRIALQPITPSNYDLGTLRRMAWRIPEPLSGRAAAQLSRMWTGRPFSSLDGSVDYLEGLGQVEVPARIIASPGDRMAPPRTVLPAAEAWGGSAVDSVVLDTPPGRDRALCHAGLLNGKAAPREVYPLVLDWLARHPA